MNIAHDEEVNPAEIEKITLYYAEENMKRCLEPLEGRRNPKTLPEAKISLPFTVAQALAYRKIEIGDFSRKALVDLVLKNLCAKTYAEYDESLKSTLSKTMLPGRVKVETKDRSVYDKSLDVIYGHPENRMQWEDLSRKFHDCALYSWEKLSIERIEVLVGMIDNLERVDNVSKILDLV